jgi:putative spermidine/putrescine transport system substrate-binding protein
MSMLTRRRVLQGSAAAAVGVAIGMPRVGHAAATKLDVYTASDANISDWMTNILKPAFEKANPDFEVNVVISRGSGTGGVNAIADRALAALQEKKDPQVDLIEEIDVGVPVGADPALWTKFGQDSLKNYARVNKVVIQTADRLPWRGSQVLLAYNSEKVSAPPKSWDELVKWIKANPGQFIYGRPDRGGSGRNFVVRAVHEANGRDPSIFKIDNFSQADADKRFPKAWEILNDLAPSLYNKGAYTAGNTPTLQLLAQGVVSMVPAWSDQALQGISQGVLPPSTKLVQLQDLALCGSFASAAVPSNAAHHDGAMKLADFLLGDDMQASVVKDIGGFPAVNFENLPPDLRAQLADVLPKSIPDFPGDKWEAAMNDGWYRNVAPNIDRTAK